jgi:hypothetical protein
MLIADAVPPLVVGEKARVPESWAPLAITLEVRVDVAAVPFAVQLMFTGDAL